MRTLKAAANAKQVLRVDALGCAVGAAVILASPTVWDQLELPRGARVPTGVTLGASAAYFAWASSKEPVRPESLKVSAGVNVGWIAMCGMAQLGRRSAVVRASLAAVALSDTAMAIMQWRAAKQKEPR